MSTSSTPEPGGAMDIFDAVDAGLACRVCGSLVAAGYREVHWSWHEAANGA